MAQEYIRNKKELAENVKLIRKCLGYTQREVAKKLNVERSTYTYYEIGKTKMSVRMLIDICEIYKIELLNLITKEGILLARIDMNC